MHAIRRAKRIYAVSLVLLLAVGLAAGFATAVDDDRFPVMRREL